MTIRRVSTVEGLRAPVGAFSQAVIARGLIYTSGQIPMLLDGSIPHGFEAQLRCTLDNLQTLLTECGSSLEHVVKLNGYLTDPDHLELYNRVYREYFGGLLPARTTVCVSLWGVSLELECVAVVSDADVSDRI
ncbi:RidA family protein [Cryobacterium sp. PH29-G1]|uniref:RidA family protein n=1 Tax=Cryobacterium sp. PH29-G1 TaxID=3046211 RepID=UPI0024BBE078|nr:RidA family protein [Cryobacterium sp. PH29-G1]MDJ0348375.1 RidA family protein [Cryobacterium sp. PH29-G1]